MREGYLVYIHAVSPSSPSSRIMLYFETVSEALVANPKAAFWSISREHIVFSSIMVSGVGWGEREGKKGRGGGGGWSGRAKVVSKVE